ncbi:MAG: alcohol dehydrogenase catalytic domain-containing protein [archaeon]|nr:alcohol dehydrogenase catalytic domain-containing protein [archaeon]
MRVAVYYNNNDVRLEEMPRPKIGPGELLVKVMASGICGSDVLEWYRIPKAPRVLGHEATGEIVEVKDEFRRYKVGDRVFVSHHVPCNKCRYCLNGHHTACETLHKTNYDPGGFAEYIRVPRINVEHGVYLLPDDLPFEDGTFIEPLGCVVRGQRLARVQKGESVLILGSGVSGLLHIQLARFLGTERIIATDINEYRLKAAKKFGADAVLHAEEDLPKRLRQLNEGRLVDRVVVCTGAISASKQALQCVDRGGTILFFAVPDPSFHVPIPVTDFWRNEITITTSYGAAPKDLEESEKLIRERHVDVHDTITHRLGLGEIGLGFKLVAEAGESLKVIIEPQR